MFPWSSVITQVLFVPIVEVLSTEIPLTISATPSTQKVKGPPEIAPAEGIITGVSFSFSLQLNTNSVSNMLVNKDNFFIL